MGHKVVILSPHSDDAALSVPSTIWLLVRGGCEVTVLTCFSRSNWAPESREMREPESVSQLRTEEDEKFAGLMGSRVQTVPLGFDDHPLRHPTLPSPILPGCEPDMQVVVDLSRALLRHVQDAQAVIVPLGLGDHLDHQTVNAAAFLVCDPATTVFYEDVPYRLSLGEDQVRSRVKWTADLWNTQFLPVRTNMNGWCDLWIRAVSCYPSQFSSEEVLRMKEKLTRMPGERLWSSSTQTVVNMFSSDERSGGAGPTSRGDRGDRD